MNDLSAANALRLIQAAERFKARLAGEFAAVHGLSVNEFLLLAHLDNAPARQLPRVELAKRMHVSASTVTRMTAPMEKVGFIARETSGRDARYAFVVLTNAGRTRLTEAGATFAKCAGQLFQDRWGEDELDVFGGFMQRLVASEPTLSV